MKRKKGVTGVLLTIVSTLVAVLFLFPVIWALAVSFKKEGTAVSNAIQWFLPPYTAQNYPRVLFDSKVPLWLFNSVVIALVSTLLVVMLSAMAAYALSKIRFKGSGLVYLFFLIGLMVPGEATISPLYIICNRLQLLDSYVGIMAPTIAVSMNMIILTNFFKGIPDELIEAAIIDGAGHGKIFARLILPLSKPVLVTVAIFAFMASWNNYLWPFLCAMDENIFTLPVGIPTFIGQYSIDYVVPLTASMVASIPAIVAYLLLERYIVEGIAMTGVKG